MDGVPQLAPEVFRCTTKILNFTPPKHTVHARIPLPTPSNLESLPAVAMTYFLTYLFYLPIRSTAYSFYLPVNFMVLKQSSSKS